MNGISRQGVVSDIVAAVRGRLPTAETYRCRNCGLTFDRERPNCHACGGRVESA